MLCSNAYVYVSSVPSVVQGIITTWRRCSPRWVDTQR
jgi:hypothetical protein